MQVKKHACFKHNTQSTANQFEDKPYKKINKIVIVNNTIERVENFLHAKFENYNPWFELLSYIDLG